MTERDLNLFGYVLVFALIGACFRIIFFLENRRRSLLEDFFWIAAGAGVGLMVFSFLGIGEFEGAYFFTVLRMPYAVSTQRVLVSKIINYKNSRWVTDDYFSDLCGDHARLTALRLETADNKTDYYFAYDSNTRTVVPMTEAAVYRFPALMPKADTLVNVNELNGMAKTLNNATAVSSIWMGDNEIKLPAKWFHDTIHPEKK